MNLRPAGFDEGELAVFAHSAKGQRIAGPVGPDGAFISFSVTNDGPQDVFDAFLTDLFVDGVFVGRWDSISVPSAGFMVVRDWDGLGSHVRLAPGEHKLRLVVDSTNAVAESDEADNIVELTFTWKGETDAEETRTRLPNLRPVPAEGRPLPIHAAAFPAQERTTSLSTAQKTFLSWGVENAGLSSIASEVVIHLYYDGALVADRRARGLLAAGRSETVDWDALAQIVPITAGEHTLRVIVDPGDLIAESDESDNAFAVRLSWGTDPVPQPRPRDAATFTPSPEPRTARMPDLMPTIPPGWDAALVARSFDAEGGPRQGRDGTLSADVDAFVGFAVWNGSPMSTGRDWEIRVFFDGRLIDQVRFSGGDEDSGKVGTHMLRVPRSLVTPGKHEVTLVVDPIDVIEEADEGNNVCHREFLWRSGPLAETPASTVLSDDELHELLQPLDSILDELDDLGGPSTGATSTVEDIVNVARAGFHLGTARHLGQERAVIHFARREIFESLALDACVGPREALGAHQYSEELARCRAGIETFVGFTGMSDGIVQVYVDAEHSPASVLNTTFHELGHALQQLVVPSEGGDPETPSVAALREAQAQTFEGVAWRAIESFLGENLLVYPRMPAMAERVHELLDQRLRGAFPSPAGDQAQQAPEEHDRGHVLMWLTALADPSSLGLAKELREEGVLSSGLVTDLFNYLLTIAPGLTAEWESDLLTEAESLIEEYRQIALNRLVEGLAPDREGHPALRGVAFLVP